MPASASAARVAAAPITSYGSLAPGLANGIMPTPATTTLPIMPALPAAAASAPCPGGEAGRGVPERSELQLQVRAHELVARVDVAGEPALRDVDIDADRVGSDPDAEVAPQHVVGGD